MVGSNHIHTFAGTGAAFPSDGAHACKARHTFRSVQGRRRRQVIPKRRGKENRKTAERCTLHTLRDMLLPQSSRAWRRCTDAEVLRSSTEHPNCQ